MAEERHWEGLEKEIDRRLLARRLEGEKSATRSRTRAAGPSSHGGGGGGGGGGGEDTAAAPRSAPPPSSCLLGGHIDAMDPVGQTATLYAVKAGRIKLVGKLLEAKADPNLPSRDTRQTPLHWAAMFATPLMTELLLEHGADCLIRNNQGETALALAVELGQGTQVAMMKGTYRKPKPMPPKLGRGKVTSLPPGEAGIDLPAIERDGSNAQH